MPLLLRRCSDCDLHFEVLSDRGNLSVVDRDDDIIACPQCDCEEIAVAFPTSGQIHGQGYPYYDRALGCRVENAAHRKRLMKERGLIEAPDYDVEDVTRDARRKAEKEEKDYAALLDRYENHPDFAEARRLRAAGHPDYQF